MLRPVWQRPSLFQAPKVWLTYAADGPSWLVEDGPARGHQVLRTLWHWEAQGHSCLGHNYNTGRLRPQLHGLHFEAPF